MAIVLSLINSLLTGAMFDDQRPGFNGCTNHWFAAYDIGQFTDPTRFVSEVQGVRSRVQRNPPRAGFDRVYAPGDIENELVQKNLSSGIPLEQFTLDELAWVAEHTGVPLPFAAAARSTS
jgi:LDH2 family malate/lactate/ureidoglycolate dehydrogenase